MDCLDKGFVQLVEHMGSDLSVVNAARCSFNKSRQTLNSDDVRLIGYLANEGHMLPFRHPQVTLRIKMPLFVARQLMKYSVGFSWSEVSRRYITDDPEFYCPKEWRAKPQGGIKQGSGEVLEGVVSTSATTTHSVAMSHCFKAYHELLGIGVAPEMARMVLPQAMYTTVVVTGSLLGWHHMFTQRTQSDTQMESREYGQAIGTILEDLFPASWGALSN